MNLPALPTDNLYKFVALSGLFILLLSFFYPARTIFELQLKQAETRTQIDLLEHDVRKALADAEAASAAGNAPRLAQIRTQAGSLDVQRIKLQGFVHRNSVLLDQLKVMYALALFGALAGFKLAWWGFRNWYLRVQVPADRALVDSESGGV